jgi:hypothetical protein
MLYSIPPYTSLPVSPLAIPVYRPPPERSAFPLNPSYPFPPVLVLLPILPPTSTNSLTPATPPPQLRQLISTQARQITYQYLLKSQPSPLTTLIGHLNPTNPWENGPPLITPDKFAADIATGVAEASRFIRSLLPAGEMRELVKMDAQERGRMMEGVSGF